MSQGKEWEKKGEYNRAIDMYVKITPNMTTDHELVEDAMVKVSRSIKGVCGLSANHLKPDSDTNLNGSLPYKDRIAIEDCFFISGTRNRLVNSKIQIQTDRWKLTNPD